jgi:flagellar protein FlaG
MDIQNSVSSSMPSGGTAGGTAVAVPAPNAGASRAVAEQKSPADARPSAASLQNAVDTINKSLKQNETSMQFSIDRNTKADVVQMVDTSTGEVISQYPSEVTLAISAAISQDMKRGVLLNQKA